MRLSLSYGLISGALLHWAKLRPSSILEDLCPPMILIIERTAFPTHHYGEDSSPFDPAEGEVLGSV
jgi:hypothetical protein